jgi:lipoprotein-anchoring transpeptidase ErfK/SrfK
MACVGILAGAVAAVTIAPSITESPKVTPAAVHVAAPTPSAPKVEGDWQPKPKAEAPKEEPDVEVEARSLVAKRAPLPMPTWFVAADAVVPSVELYAAGGVPMGRAMSNPTQYGLPLVFRVMKDQGPWLDVQVSTRPNGFRAFIKRSDVKIRLVPNWIKVRLSDRSVTVFHGDTPLLQTVGTIGKAESPTPTGWFFVDASVILNNPNGPYGSGQLALSGYSDVYYHFAGGVGQIALHGTNAPGLMGQAASNGCVRLVNDVFLEVQKLAPLGTPVQIVP